MDWKGCVGKTGEEAKKMIMKDKPDAKVEIMVEGSPMTKDMNPNRVRVMVDAHQKVVSAPKCG